MEGFRQPGYHIHGYDIGHKTSESEVLKEAMLNSLPAQLAVLDRDGIILTVNESWRKFAIDNTPYQLPEGDFRGVNYLTVCKKSGGPFSEGAPDAINGILGVLKGDISAFSMEYSFHLPDMQRWFLMKVYSLAGHPGAVVSHTDITEQKELERTRDEFISIASHELKTPITSLKGIAHILQLSFGKRIKGEGARLLSTMDIQLNKLSKMIGDLVVVNTMPGKRIRLSVERFDFKNLVSETVENVKNISQLHFLSIKENESVFINGDRFRLEQVITNLLTNAVKYSPQSNQVIVNSIVKDNQVLFSVQDFGIGIDKENATKVFERFYRVKTNSTFGGFGLGLYISAEIIKAHKGKIWVESEGGNGSVFYFSLPLGKDQNDF